MMSANARMRLTSAQLPQAIELSPWLWVAAGALVLLVALSISCFLRRGRAHAHPPANGGRAAGIEQDLHATMRELSAMIVSAQTTLDARADRLERLIQAADERIERLASAGDGRGSGSNGHDNHLIAAPPAHSASDEVDPRHVEIYDLSDDGLNPRQIADQLGRPSGEVELILALRPRPRTPA